MTQRVNFGSRPTNLEELELVLQAFWDDQALERGLAFKPQPTDIIIPTYAKCGTTWIQQVAHGLRTRGSMDFNEITEVTPWIEIAYDVGWDLDAPQEAEPRLFKSHLAYHEVPKGGRYIVSFRHYVPAYLSFYRFFEGWYFEPGEIGVEELLRWRWPREEMGEKGYWYHLASWWAQRDNPNLLLLCYEDMIADHPGTVRRIADFMGIDLDDELFDIVMHQSSREFMLAHKDKYDANHIVKIGGKRAGLPAPLDSAKVTSGTDKDERYHLSDESRALLDDIWREQITPKFGFETYDELREALRELNAARDEPAS